MVDVFLAREGTRKVLPAQLSEVAAPLKFLEVADGGTAPFFILLFKLVK